MASGECKWRVQVANAAANACRRAVPPTGYFYPFRAIGQSNRPERAKATSIGQSPMHRSPHIISKPCKGESKIVVLESRVLNNVNCVLDQDTVKSISDWFYLRHGVQSGTKLQ